MSQNAKMLLGSLVTYWLIES